MRRIKILIAVLFVTLYSCDKYLDVIPDNVATLDNVFSDAFNAEKFLFTCYSYMPIPGDHTTNPALVSGDEIWFPLESQGVNGQKIARGQQNASAPYFNFWNGELGGKNLYIAIRDCNILLENIDKVQDLASDEKERWKAEANFLKAYYHFYLLRLYGPVSIVDKNVDISAEVNEYMLFREPVDTCIEYITNLLDIAAAGLPMTIESVTTELGRATKPIAMALKAQVLMIAASPLFNGNNDYIEFKDSRGRQLISTEYSDEKWTKAADAVKEAIDICHEAGKKLLAENSLNEFAWNYSLRDSLKRGIMLRSTVTDPWNDEIIWGSTQGTTGALQRFCQPKFEAANPGGVTSCQGATFKIAEMFYTDKGLPINQDVTWPYNERFQLKTAGAEDRHYIRQGQQTVKLNYNREPRFYAYLGFDRGIWYGCGRYSDNPANLFYIQAKFGEPSSFIAVGDYSVSGYWPKKVVHPFNDLKSTSYFQVNYSFPVIRLAELYLYYAEALNEIGNPTEAKVWLNKIRSRAGIGDVDFCWQNYSASPGKSDTKEGLREIIQQETLIEMCFEGARFWDLRRWKLAEQYLNAPVVGWNPFENTVVGYYRLVKSFNQRFTPPRDYLWPIKVDELLKNSNLVQNPGW
jgi:hypothetical protein